MKTKFSKQDIMKHYYSDEELIQSMKTPLKSAMKWLEETKNLMRKALPKSNRKTQLLLQKEGW